MLGWDFIQQIGFRHFAEEVLSGRLPPWVGQGLSTYFGAARWTGDGLTAGDIPAALVTELRNLRKEQKLTPFDQVLGMNLMAWYQPAGQQQRNEQAWGMVQFLIHGDGGKYSRPFGNYVADAGKGTPPAEAFARNFGTDAKTFQARFEQWLAGPQAEPNAALATEATVATMTSFLARAAALKASAATFEEFLQSAKDKKVLPEWSKAPALWLPESLLTQCLQEAGKLSTWSVDTKRTPPALVLTESGGVTYTGSFSLPPGRRPTVKVERKEPKPAPPSRPATVPARSP
jgi:hypothetical protein